MLQPTAEAEDVTSTISFPDAGAAITPAENVRAGRRTENICMMWMSLGDLGGVGVFDES
jgi:hypothetical protein